MCTSHNMCQEEKLLNKLMRLTVVNIHKYLPTCSIFFRKEKNNKTHDVSRRTNENKNSVGSLIFISKN